MTMEEAAELLSREERFMATVSAMNALMIAKGVYTAEEIEAFYAQWAMNQQKTPKHQRPGWTHNGTAKVADMPQHPSLIFVYHRVDKHCPAVYSRGHDKCPGHYVTPGVYAADVDVYRKGEGPAPARLSCRRCGGGGWYAFVCPVHPLKPEQGYPRRCCERATMQHWCFDHAPVGACQVGPLYGGRSTLIKVNSITPLPATSETIEHIMSHCGLSCFLCDGCGERIVELFTVAEMPHSRFCSKECRDEAAFAAEKARDGGQ